MTKTVIINTKNVYGMQEILTEFCKTYIIAHADEGLHRPQCGLFDKEA